VSGTRFDTDTAVTPLGDGRFAADIDREWWVGRGPHGGYVAAIVMRALTAALGDPERAPRSLTIHFTAPPREGPAEIEARVERSGRSLSTLSARMTQGERLVALALAAFSRPYPSAVEFAEAPPAVRPPEDARPVPEMPDRPGFIRFLDMRPALGARPFSGSEEALTGGWLRLAEPRPLDPVALAFYADAWWPAAFPRLERPALAPTVDLTVHFRATLPVTEEPHDFLLGAFRSRTAGEGFVEEDGELWTRDGRLLAQSRQLALLVPPPA
jgi:acyl-CoA thioesterase